MDIAAPVIFWVLGFVVVIIGIVFAVFGLDRYRPYKKVNGGAGNATDHGAASDMQPTSEVFVDPVTGMRQQVWADPKTGAREYRDLP